MLAHLIELNGKKIFVLNGLSSFGTESGARQLKASMKRWRASPKQSPSAVSKAGGLRLLDLSVQRLPSPTRRVGSHRLREKLANSTANIPVRKMPSKVLAPPMEANLRNRAGRTAMDIDGIEWGLLRAEMYAWSVPGSISA